ncbi:hypothetical protein XA68_13668 [Ophiocordyceps unilateralis]|uniref:Hydrophobin n=1 Tax=Ophiocordyceps unilateralis TaxID=268505 RepID=A0A2A9PC15_OPHUN|nr:hypothetical protein XA68_13668 [Ophiocordyceps unilateralis]
MHAIKITHLFAILVGLAAASPVVEVDARALDFEGLPEGPFPRPVNGKCVSHDDIGGGAQLCCSVHVTGGSAHHLRPKPEVTANAARANVPKRRSCLDGTSGGGTEE